MREVSSPLLRSSPGSRTVLLKKPVLAQTSPLSTKPSARNLDRSSPKELPKKLSPTSKVATKERQERQELAILKSRNSTKETNNVAGKGTRKERIREGGGRTLDARAREVIRNGEILKKESSVGSMAGSTPLRARQNQHRDMAFQEKARAEIRNIRRKDRAVSDDVATGASESGARGEILARARKHAKGIAEAARAKRVA